MDNLIAVFVVSFFFCFLVIKVLKPIAILINLVDKPGGRKMHDGAVPLIGGIAIYGSVVLSSILFVEQPIFIRFFMVAGGLIVFMGTIDDRYHLSAGLRLGGQILISCIFVYGLGVHIQSFGNILGVGELNPGGVGYLLAVLSLVGLTNAMNMLDGMDGVVGSVSLVSFLGLSMLFGVGGNPLYQTLCMAFVGSLAAFLLFNFGDEKTKIKKVFMGDAGSMFLGLSLGVLLIKGAQQSPVAFSPVTALWFVLFPMTDMFTIMYRRVKRGRSPMSPDRTHMHHILLRAGFSKFVTLQIILLAQLGFMLLGVLLNSNGVSEFVSFVLAIVFVILYQLLMKSSWRLLRWTKRNLV